MRVRIIPTELGRQMIAYLKYMNDDNKMPPSDLKLEVMQAFTTHKPNKMPNDFQHRKADALVIYDDKNTEVYRKIGNIPKKILNKLASRHPKATVMTSLGNGLFKSIPIKQYKKLVKIKFILFERSFEFLSHEFPDELLVLDEWFDMESIFEYIYSINHLLMLLTTEEAFDKANQIFLTAKFFRLTSIEKTYKILYRNDSIKEFTYEEFLDKYKLKI